MSNLPPGWDLDYDGSRWFYRYRSSGLTQYTFPQEGDEFPDFVEAGAPAPALAPEEKLESQQQVRRRGDANGGNGFRSKNSAMSATGGPVSTTWEDDDDDGDYGHFQPENFMFLGPGTYTDVSPLADEDERDGLSSRGTRKDASPSMSKATTDAASDRVMSPPVSSISTPQPSRAEPVVEHEVLAVDTPHQATVTPSADQAPAPEVPMLDGRERPHELPEAPSFNPVGLMAEMPTEDTARAHIELHPDPVEIADNSVLAPIETFYMNIAELPSQTSPVQRKEAEPPPQRRRATSQPLQRVYPFQPKEDDDPNRPPTPLGPSPIPTPSPKPPIDATSQEQNQTSSPFTPSDGTTPVTSPPGQPKPDAHTPPDTEQARRGSQPRSTNPQEPFKITRKPTSAGPKTGYKVPSPPDTSPKRVTGEARAPRTSAGPAAKDASAPPPVPAKDTVSTDPAPGQPGIPSRIQQRPHSNSLPGSLRPSGNPASPDVLQQFKSVPQSLQPGTPPPLPVAVPGKGKAMPKPRATPSPLGYAKRTARQDTPAPDEPGPGVVSPPDPPSGRSPPEQPLLTPSPLEIRRTSSGVGSSSSPESQPTSAGPSAAHPLAVPGASPGAQAQAQHQKVFQPQQGAPTQVEPHAAGSYFPPQPSRPPGQLARSAEGKDRLSPPSQSANPPSGGSSPDETRASRPTQAEREGPGPGVFSNVSSLGAQQAVPRTQKHQQAPPIPPKRPLPPQSQPQAAPQPAPRQDSTIGHLLDPITEQPEHEDAASLARKASLASQASSHRHSMPPMPTGYGNSQSHSVAPPRDPRTAQPTPQSVQQLQQQQNPGGGPSNLARPPPQQNVQGIRAPHTVAPPKVAPPIQPHRQQQPIPGMYFPQPIPVVAGHPAGKPPTAQLPEKGKSKWLSKLLKSSKTSQKPTPPEHQHVWNGPLVMAPSQSPASAAPWSPGSVGATLAAPPPTGGQGHGSRVPPQQVPPNVPPGSRSMNDGQTHQRQASGGWPTVSMSVGELGPKQLAPVEPKTVPSEAPPHHPAPVVSQPPGPLSMNPVAQSSPQANPGRVTTSEPSQSSTPTAPPVSMEQAQSPSSTGPDRSESVKSNLTTGFVRSESVRSDFTTISTSEAQVQPVLKPQIVQVSRPPSMQQVSQPPQIRYEPARSPLDEGANGQPAQRPDSLRALPHHLQHRLSAEGFSARESMISEVSSADSADSRRVSVLSTGSVTPRNKAVSTGNYSGGGWGDVP